MSLAARLDSAVTRSRETWVRQSDIHECLSALGSLKFDLTEGLEEPNSPSSLPREYHPRSLRSDLMSCYTKAMPHKWSISTDPAQDSADGISVLDGEYGVSELPHSSIIGTGLAHHLAGGNPLLEENNGVLELTKSRDQPVYECVFWFLNCGY